MQNKYCLCINIDLTSATYISTKILPSSEFTLVTDTFDATDVYAIYCLKYYFEHTFDKCVVNIHKYLYPDCILWL